MEMCAPDLQGPVSEEPPLLFKHALSQRDRHMSSGASTVKSFKSEMEAHLAQSKLESVGISATVNRFSRYRAMASGGYILKVHPKDLKRARAVLDKIDREIDMDQYISSDDDTYRRCPKCDSVNVEVKRFTRRKLWVAIFLIGIPLLFMKREYTCRKCGHGWVE